MRTVIVQFRPVKGDMTENIKKHQHWINRAVSREAHAVFFPELSLTGYEPTLAKELAIEATDERLVQFQVASDMNNITIGVGAPCKNGKNPFISMFIFQPRAKVTVYSKQLLHADEAPFFTSGNEQVIVDVEGIAIGLGICYETLQTAQAQAAFNVGAQMYVASVAKSKKGIDKANAHYPSIARKFAMPVLMSNSVGYCDDFYSAGQSAVWDVHGDRVIQLDGENEGILMYDVDAHDVMGKLP